MSTQAPTLAWGWLSTEDASLSSPSRATSETLPELTEATSSWRSCWMREGDRMSGPRFLYLEGRRSLAAAAVVVVAAGDTLVLAGTLTVTSTESWRPEVRRRTARAGLGSLTGLVASTPPGAASLVSLKSLPRRPLGPPVLGLGDRFLEATTPPLAPFLMRPRVPMELRMAWVSKVYTAQRVWPNRQCEEF